MGIYMALPRAVLDKVYQVLIQYTIMISSANDGKQSYARKLSRIIKKI